LGRRSRKRGQSDGAGGSRAQAAGPSRSERRDAEARAKLEPLEKGERPRAVTVAAVAAFTLAAANLVAYLSGMTIDGQPPAPSAIVVNEALLLVAGFGMWRAQYWAVLGFEFILGLLIVYLVIYLVGATKLIGVVVALAIAVPAAVLFWFLVRAMARLQMPKPTRGR
jgi:hypothetical protein